MPTPKIVERKLKAAEDQARAVLKGYGLTTTATGSGSSLEWPQEEPCFAKATRRDQQRMIDARNVLISVREVRERRDRGDVDGALRFMSYVEQSADLLEQARRGKVTVESASAGGRAKATAKKATVENRHAEWREYADGIWRSRPKLSASAVAQAVAKKHGGNPETIRKRIADLKPKLK